MTAYAIQGDIDHCKQIYRYMQLNGITVTIVEYCTLMKCYSFAKQPLNAISIYQDTMKPVIDNAVLDLKTVRIMASIRMSCYSSLMQDILNKDKLTQSDIKNVKNYFKMIMQEIPYDVKLQSKYEGDNFYKYLDNKLLQRMLNTLIIMNENGTRLGKDYENEMLTFLENGLMNGAFGFWHPLRKQTMDFHGFWTSNCRLFLRYFVTFDREYIENTLDYYIQIFVGKGTHSMRNIRKDHMKGTTSVDDEEEITFPIADAIVDEVSNWNPPVKINKLEDGMTYSLDADDLKTFLFENQKRSPFFHGRKPT